MGSVGIPQENERSLFCSIWRQGRQSNSGLPQDLTASHRGCECLRLVPTMKRCPDWPLPTLRPKRSAYGFAVLRFRSGQ